MMVTTDPLWAMFIGAGVSLITTVFTRPSRQATLFTGVTLLAFGLIGIISALSEGGF